MITFSNNIQNVLQQPTIESFYLVDIDGYKTTSFYTNITLSNNEVFLADGRLLEVDPPKLSTSVDRELYQISFADPDMFFGGPAETALVGRPVTVRLGFVDQTTKQPYLNINDTVIIYKGFVDSGAYDLSLEDNGSSVFSVSCASPMANLDMVRTLLTSRESLANIDVNDTSFNSVYQGSGQIRLKWGKG